MNYLKICGVVTVSVLAHRVSSTATHILQSNAPQREDWSQKLCQAYSLNPDGYQPPFADAKLLQVHVFTRHGDRTPLNLMNAPGVEQEVTWDCSDSSQDVSVVVGESGGSTLTRQKVHIPRHAKAPFTTTMWKGSCALGQLTPKGADMHRALGKTLRQVYVKKLGFLPHSLSNDVVFARSTDVW
jgi:acid phosphatase